MKKSKVSKASPKKTPRLPYFRPVWAEISHKNLRHNLSEISRLLPPRTSVLAVVKANAYGHGLVPVSRTLSAAGVAFLGITSVEESLELKKAGIRTPALILGNIYPFSNLETAIKNSVRVTVASVESARMCDQFARKFGKKVHVHAKIDTGMNRIGVSVNNAVPFIHEILKFRSIQLEGIYTHFSSSAEDPYFTKVQIDRFDGLVERLRAQKAAPPYIHCANSAAILRYPETHFSLVRPGLSLYGVTPVPLLDSRVDLRPILTWKSRIIFLKDVPAGTPVSYAGTFVTQRKSKIATAAFGYADGYRRNLSNKGWVLVNGRRVPAIGRITMDMTMLDVTDVPSVNVGDEVVLIGKQGNETMAVQELAGWANTSPYETFCAISSRVPRIGVD